MAVDRVGHHIVAKIFKLCSLAKKLEMSLELVKEKNRLSGNSMGRSVMKTCFLHQLMESEHSWRERISKEAEAEQFVLNIAVQDGIKKKRKRRKGQEA